MDLTTSIEFLKGIGPERAKLISKVFDVNTVEDFLSFYPIRYIDKSKTYQITDLKEENTEIQLKGRISDLQEITYGKGNKRLSAKFSDGTGSMDLVWFQYSQWLKEQIPINRDLYIFGKVSLFNQQFSMAHPEIEIDEKKQEETRLKPIYPSSEKLTKRGLNQKFFQNTLAQIITHVPRWVEENLPQSLLKSLKLMPKKRPYSIFIFLKIFSILMTPTAD